MTAHPTRAALLCPGLYQYLKGEWKAGGIFFALAAICLTTMAFYARAEADPFGHQDVRLAIAATVLFWAALFSALDAFQRPGRAALYLILLPAIVLFSIFTYLPIIWAVKLAFYDHDLQTLVYGGAPFAGLSNFADIVHDDKFWLGLSNTMKFFIIGFLLGQFPAPALAYLLNEVPSRRVQTFYKCICIMPSLFSWPIIGAIWLWILKPGGQLDVLIEIVSWGTVTEPLPWLGDPTTARYVFVSVGLWMGTGVSALIWLASLANIDPSMYEAAQIDGADHWQKFRHLTFPLLIPTWVVLTILAFIGMFSIFDQVIVMGNPSIREAVFVVMIHIFETGLRVGAVGYAAAMSLVLCLIVLIMTAFNLKVSSKMDVTG